MMTRKVFDEVVLFARTGLNPRTNFKLGNGNNKYITIKNIHNNRLIVDENTDLVDDAALGLIHKRSQIKKGDILFCSIGRLGDMYIISDEPQGWDINESVFAFTVDTDLIRQKYFYYLFKNKDTIEYLSKNSSGSTFKSIKMNQLKKMVFELPSLDEQDQIVEKLDLATNLIEKRQNELVRLDELIKARFVEMFGDLKLNRKGWEIISFDEMSELITDGEHATPRRTASGIYLLSARNVLNHSIQLNDVDYIDQEEYGRISKRIIPREGDILISCSGSVGRCCCVPAGLKFQMVRSIALIRFKDNVLPKFAEYMITSDFVQEQIDASKTASSQANLFQGKIAKLKGIVPPIGMQKDFVEFVEQVDKSKVEVQKALEKTQLLFDSLMQEYFG